MNKAIVPKIDVIMLTWNSNRSYFKRVLELIKCYVPVHKFIVVDRYSTDGTLEVVKDYFSDAVIVQTKANLAWARRIGIEYADCEIIAFIDDDVFISEKWVRVLYSLMQSFPTIGMVYSLHGLIRPGGRLIETLRKRSDVNVKDLIFKGLSVIRGRTIATMIRRTLVLDWNPPKELSAFEDYHLAQHILSKGALVIQINKPLALHAPGNPRTSLRIQFKKAAWNGAGMRLTNAMNLFEVGAYGLARIIQGLIPGQQRRLKYAGYRNQLDYALAQVGYIVGWLAPYRYLVSKR